MTLYSSGFPSASKPRIRRQFVALFLAVFSLGLFTIDVTIAKATSMPPSPSIATGQMATTLTAPIIRDISVAANPGLPGPSVHDGSMIRDYTPEVIVNCEPGTLVAIYGRVTKSLLGSAPCGTFPPGSGDSQHSVTLSYVSLPNLRSSERVDAADLPFGTVAPVTENPAAGPVATPPEIKQVRIDRAGNQILVDYDAPVACNRHDPRAAQQFNIAIRPTILRPRSITYSTSLVCPRPASRGSVVVVKFATGALRRLGPGSIVRFTYDEYGCYQKGGVGHSPLVIAAADTSPCVPTDPLHVPSSYEYVALGKVHAPRIIRLRMTSTVSTAGGPVVLRWQPRGAAVQCEVVISPPNAPVAATPTGVVATLPCSSGRASFTLGSSPGPTRYQVSLDALGPLPVIASASGTVSVR